jgi:hypothetical protein
MILDKIYEFENVLALNYVDYLGEFSPEELLLNKINSL